MIGIIKMKKANYRFEVIEQSSELPLFCEKQRQIVISDLVEKALAKCAAEEEAIGSFLWKSKGPVNQNELMLFHALYLMHQSSRNTRIDSEEKALAILEMSEVKTALQENELIKEVKLCYWKIFNETTCDLKLFLKNARAIGMKKSAFDFILNTHTSNEEPIER